MTRTRYNTLDADTFIGKIDAVDCSNNRFIRPQKSWRGDELSTHYGDWDELGDKDQLNPADTYVLVEYASGSDYSGNLVERSNYRALVEMIEASNADGDESKCEIEYIEYTGGYGTFALAVKVDTMDQELAETIAALSDYPLVDDSLHSEMELEAQNENWDSWARSDFRRELERIVANEIEAQMPDDSYWPYVDWVKDGDWMDTVDDSTVSGWAWDLMEIANVYWENEQGNSCYIDVERMAKALVEPIEQDWRNYARDKQLEVQREVFKSVHNGWARAWWGQFVVEEIKLTETDGGAN